MDRHHLIGLLGVLFAVGSGVESSRVAYAQRAAPALSGRPFGVAQIAIPLPETADRSFVDSAAFELVEKNGRAFYPAFATGRFAEIVSEFLGEEAPDLPGRLNVSFLFVGDEPLELTVFTPEPNEFVLNPAPPRRAREFQKALSRWWRAYNAIAREQVREGDFPPLVQTYLTTMLSERLKLPPPPLTRWKEADPGQFQQTAGMLFGTDERRSAVMRETLRGGGGLGETASIPAPLEIAWQPLALPADIPHSEVEPIAQHVPQECCYIRFGSFENYLWLDHLQKDYGGEIGQMVTLRGHNPRLSEKIQRQLALKQSALAELMGPQVISDVALIGHDLYFRDGAALGMLFEAKNSAVLGTTFAADRQAALQQAQKGGATIETVSIAGHDVSFLSTPDNRLRSFYAVDGNYHFVTTSRSLVERFYAAGAGQGALGASAEFQHARSEMPLTREDTVFAYFSSAFFRGLLSPQYQIELTRRLQSVTDMELVQLAQLAASNESREHRTIDDLIAGGFLPRGFGQRGQGMPPVVTEHGFIDPLRGVRGTFTPIPDVPLNALTPTEAALYNRCAQFLETQWRQMDPLMVGVKRYALDQDRQERVVIDANVSPLAEEKYGWVLSLVGPPTDVRIQSDPTDVIAMQMSLRGGLLRPSIPAHHVFVGVQDVEPNIDPIPTGILKTLHILQTTPGYLGAWPELGLLDLLPIPSTQPDTAGFSSLPLGLWRWQGDGFSVLSFHRGVLAEAAGHLQPVATDDPAQIRIRVSDLAHSKLANWISALNYHRAYQTSLGNVRLLNALTQQFRISPAEALEIANGLLDTQLVCTLGGKYEFVQDPHGLGVWRSTAWPSAATNVLPANYVAPLLGWFRGASVDLTKQGDGMFLHAEVDMLRKEREPAVKLPLFSLFGKQQDDAQAGD